MERVARDGAAAGMRHGANAQAGIHPHRDVTAARTIAKEREYPEIVAIIEEEEQRRGRGATSESKAEAIGDESARVAVAAGDMEWLREQHAGGTFVNPIRWNGGGLLTVAVRENQLEALALLLDSRL